MASEQRSSHKFDSIRHWRPRGATLTITILSWICFLHVAGIYLFTRGFLLTRMALPNISESCSNCTLPQTHDRLVLLIIDALRFDFVSPEPPRPHSPYHHNVLTFPREMSEKYPSHSFLFHTYADPPTTTMQRIKGITTGSLPTFIDISSNFGATSIEEDSLLLQLARAEKRVRIIFIIHKHICTDYHNLHRQLSWGTIHGCPSSQRCLLLT
jgi:phosphatidylinositol glycan class O